MISEHNKEKKYSYADYLTWSEDERWELINGDVWSMSKDESQKLKLYEEYGVHEYWIVNPEAEYIMIYHHNGADFDKPDYYRGNDVIKSRTLEGFCLSLPDIFR